MHLIFIPFLNQPVFQALMARVKGILVDQDEVKERHNVMMSPSSYRQNWTVQPRWC